MNTRRLFTLSSRLLVLCLSVPALADTDMIAYWRFDEGGGPTAQDDIADNDGTIFGAQWTTGQVGGALVLDGTDDYVDMVGPGPLGNSPRTVLAWARTSSTSSQQILSYGGDGSEGTTFRVGLSAAGWCEGVTVDAAFSALTYSASVADDQWHLYAFVVPEMENATIEDVLVYQDGQLLTAEYVCYAFREGTVINSTGEHPIDVGRFYLELKDYFVGQLDEVAIYRRALSGEEIREHYQNGLAGQGYLLGPATTAINKIQQAIFKKTLAWSTIDEALHREQAAYDALSELLDSDDYQDLCYSDIVTAMKTIHYSMQDQQRIKEALESTIETLQNALDTILQSSCGKGSVSLLEPDALQSPSQLWLLEPSSR